jgi:hypothetical protein
VLKSTSGSKGEVRSGKYVILDPRTEFFVPEDTEIVISFEWLGRAGPHRLSGTWRGPRATSTTTEFDYTAVNREFGAYWTLKLPPGVPAGPWRLEAAIDGQPAGVHEFTITEGTGGTAAAAATRRMPLTRQELYARGAAALVTVEAFDAAGARLGSAAGTLIDEGTVLTTFGAVNGAALLRVRRKDGSSADVKEVTGLSYKGGWARLQPAMAAGPALLRATDPVTVGVPCVSFEVPADGSLSIVGGEVSGMGDVPRVGPRLTIAFNGAVTPGVPVLNDFGDVIAFVPSGPIGDHRIMLSSVLLGNVPGPAAGEILPISAIPPSNGVTASLADLAATGTFVPRITEGTQVLSGGFSVSVQHAGARTQPVDQRVEFSPRDQSITTFITWDPKKKFKGTTTARIFDDENRLLGELKPMKLSLRPGDLILTSWQMGVPRRSGVYRVDVLLATDVAWRGYFRVTD